MTKEGERERVREREGKREQDGEWTFVTFNDLWGNKIFAYSYKISS